MRHPVAVFVGSVAAFAVAIALAWGSLPERVATHFDAGGQPDGWSGRDGFLVVYGIVGLVNVALFAGLGALVARLPAGMINMPNRAYWLAHERRAETAAYLGDAMLWIGALTMLFLAALLYQITAANDGEAPPSALDGTFWVVLGGYFVGVGVVVVALLRRFARVPAATG